MSRLVYMNVEIERSEFSYFCIVGYYVNNFEPIPALPKDLARRDIFPLKDGRDSLAERGGM